MFRSYGVRIESMAIDFLKDERDIVYFIDLCGFRVPPSSLVSLNRLALLSGDAIELKKLEA